MRDFERDLSISLRPVACANPHCDSGEHVAVRGEFCRTCRRQQQAARQSLRQRPAAKLEARHV